MASEPYTAEAPPVTISILSFYYSRHSSRSKTPSAATTPTGASNTRAQHRAALAAQQQAAEAAAAAAAALAQQPQQQQQQQPAKQAGFCEICEHHFDNLTTHLVSTEHAVAVGLKDWGALDKALDLVNA